MVFASDNASGNLDIFCGGRGVKIAANALPMQTIPRAAGWGLAVHGSMLAVGQGNGTIALYKNLPSLVNAPEILNLANGPSGYNAYGLAFDQWGGLYASEWPGPYLDYWRDPKGGGKPCEYESPDISEVYYVAAHSVSVDIYGFDGNTSDVDAVIDNVKGMRDCDPTERQITTLGSLADGDGFPGGIVTDKNGFLYANNQYGTLYSLGQYPGRFGQTGEKCSWGFDPNDVTNINVDSNQSGIWAANINFGNSPLTSVSHRLLAAGTERRQLSQPRSRRWTNKRHRQP